MRTAAVGAAGIEICGVVRVGMAGEFLAARLVHGLMVGRDSGGGVLNGRHDADPWELGDASWLFASRNYCLAMAVRVLFPSALSLLSAPTVIPCPSTGPATPVQPPAGRSFPLHDKRLSRSPNATCAVHTVPSSAAVAPWTLPDWGEIWGRPLPFLARWRPRLILRSMLSAFGRDVIGIHGAERLSPESDAFILAINHSTRLEALLLPILFAFLRRGKLVSFVADWNFALIPGVATVLRDGETILLVRKPARPAFLNVFKPLYERQGPAFERLSRALTAGRSVGFFPEGTTNRHPTQLLRGFDGVARLSLATGCPVLPAGVRFPGQASDRPIRERTRMEIFIGDFLRPSDRNPTPTRAEVRGWHERIMREIGRLSGKQWDAGATRKKHHGLE